MYIVLCLLPLGGRIMPIRPFGQKWRIALALLAKNGELHARRTCVSALNVVAVAGAAAFMASAEELTPALPASLGIET